MRPQAFRTLVLLAGILCSSVACPQASPAQSPGTAESPLGKGYDALRQGRYQIAEEGFRAALALDASLVLRAQFPLAVALFEQHKSAEARREFEAVRKATGDHPNVSYYLGRLDVEKGDFAGAIRNFSTAMTKPPFPDTAYYLGFAYFKQGNLANAEKWLKEAQQAIHGIPESRTSWDLCIASRAAKKSLRRRWHCRRIFTALITPKRSCAPNAVRSWKRELARKRTWCVTRCTTTTMRTGSPRSA